MNRLVGRSIICQSSGRYLIPLSVRYCTSVGNLFLVITAAIVRYCSRVRVIVVIPIIVPGAAGIIRSTDSIVRTSRTRSRRSRPPARPLVWSYTALRVVRAIRAVRYPSVIRVIRVLSVRYSCIIAFIVRTPPSVQYPLLPSIFLRVRIDSLASLTFWSLYSPHACVVSDRCSLFALLHLSRIVSPNFVSSLSVIVRSRCRPPVIAIESFGRGLSEIQIGIDLVGARLSRSSSIYWSPCYSLRPLPITRGLFHPGISSCCLFMRVVVSADRVHRDIDRRHRFLSASTPSQLSCI